MSVLLGGGRYEILAKVASGGQGTVYRARDTRRDRTVAVKVSPDRAGAEREARALYDLPPDPALPVVRDDFVEGDCRFLVMDWVAGRPLSTFTADGRCRDVAETLRILGPVAGALERLHEHGIVHGDVKPSNIIVTSSSAVLVDLGSSVRHEPSAGASIGTRGFRAPEMAVDGVGGPASDIYGLAATALTLLSGAAPNPGTFPPLPLVSAADLPEVSAAIERGLAYDPHDRPASPTGFLSLLEPTPATEHNLPRVLTSFVGRTADRERLVRLTREERLVTLVGAPGVGKTRLAVESARSALGWFPGGVWFVDLAPLRDARHLVQQIAAVLGVQTRLSRRLEAALIGRLSQSPSLLILDNCEHVRDGCAAFATSVADADAPLHILATSRAALGAPREHVVELAPLAIPPSDEAGQEGELAEGVRLFTERALLWSHGRYADLQAPSAVARIVRRLDGLPLAIEIAASRAATSGLADLEQHLGELLIGPGEHPLSAAIAWSYDLLTPDQRSTLDHASTFAGPFEAEALASITDQPVATVEEHLSTLVAQSLVHRSGASRYRLLETVREFAAGRLEKSGRAEQARQAHAEYFRALAVRDGPGVSRDHRARACLDALDDSRDDLRLMFDALLEQGRVDAASQAAARLTNFWLIRGYWADGTQILHRILAEDVHADARAAAEAGAGRMALTAGDLDAAESHQRAALECATATEQEPIRAVSNIMLGAVALRRGEFAQFEQLVGVGRAIAEQIGDERSIALAHNALGTFRDYRGDYAGAAEHFADSLALYRKLGDDHQTAILLNNLGVEQIILGDLAAAEDLHREALQLRRRIGDPQGVAGSLSCLGECAAHRGSFDDAARSFSEALAIRRNLGDVREAAVEIANLADVALARLEIERAESRYREALEMIEGVGDRPFALLIKRGLGWTQWAMGDLARAKRTLSEVADDAAAAGVDEEEASALHGLCRVHLDEEGPTQQVRAMVADAIERRLAAGRVLRLLNVLETAAAALGREAEGAWVLASAAKVRREKGLPRRPVHEAFVRRHLPAEAFDLSPNAPAPQDAARRAVELLRDPSRSA